MLDERGWFDIVQYEVIKHVRINSARGLSDRAKELASESQLCDLRCSAFPKGRVVLKRTGKADNNIIIHIFTEDTNALARAETSTRQKQNRARRGFVIRRDGRELKKDSLIVWRTQSSVQRLLQNARAICVSCVDLSKNCDCSISCLNWTRLLLGNGTTTEGSDDQTGPKNRSIQNTERENVYEIYIRKHREINIARQWPLFAVFLF